MTNLIHKTGDIFSTEAHGIGHGVNLHGIMGSGIAVQFRERFADMHKAYQIVCANKQMNPGQAMIWLVKDDYFVYNIASQQAPGANARLDWLESGVKAALEHAEEVGIESIALPRIGSGVGGLDQDDVEAVLLRLAEESPVDIELWTLPPKD